MTNKKLWALGLGLALGCSQAFAWMAMASGDDSGTSIYYGADTPEQATEGAMKMCRERRSGCKVGQPVNGTAMVVAKGDGGWGNASNPVPQQAHAQALEQCRQVARNCRVTQAVWDPGVLWGALAVGGGSAHIRVNASSKEQAESEALAGCRKSASDPQGCALSPRFSQSARLFYARAGSGTSFGFGTGSTAEKAKALALEGCTEHSKDAACKVETVVLNDTEAPEPAGMAALHALAKRNVSAPQAGPTAPRRTVSTTNSTNVVSCTNQCVNGACVRTFADGRKERWTAPRKYDPFTRNWGWDTTTNACGT